MTSEYVELHCHSSFSLLDGASTPEALVQRAVGLGMNALALTEHDAVYSAIRFDKAANGLGIRPIFGAELTLEGGFHLTLLVENEIGWQNLCWLISRGRENAPKGNAVLPPNLLAGHTDGLIALSGCGQSEIATALRVGHWSKAVQAAQFLRDLFGRHRFWIELQHHLLPVDSSLVYKSVQLAQRIGVGYAATNNVHYTTRHSQPLQDVLVCIRHGRTLSEAGSIRRPNSEYYLKSERAMRALFGLYPEAITNTRLIAERCQFTPHYGLQDLPVFPAPDHLTAEAYLAQLCEQALPKRLSDVSERARELLNYELKLIARHGLANYFLIVWDVVRYSREHGIRCQGRGSSANSLVAYLLSISAVNPLAHQLVFERFLSEERRATPDIDIDFQADRREEVIQYMYARYGADHAAMACTLVTFRHKSAIREVGKVLGLPPEILDQRARLIHGRNAGDLASPSFSNEASPDIATDSPIWKTLDDLCRQIIGLPRHLGIHNGGMILMGSPLSQRVATEPATMPQRVVIQWDKDSLEDAGLVKIDILGLRMLSAVADSLTAIQTVTGDTPDLDALTFDDPAIYDLICRADTVGVFQVESRAQAQVLPQLLPRKFEDLIVGISLIRPGPIQGNMVHPYLRRRLGTEPVTYLHPALEPALAETLGVILFQEQVLKVARDLGQLTAGQGELLRRALGKSDNEAVVSHFQAAFLEGALGHGASMAVASTVFNQLRAFGGYSFPKSHAAAFAVLVYQSAWLKHYYPTAFYTALLNNQPMGFWSPAVITHDARHHHIEVLPVDIQRSAARCTIEPDGIQLGFNYVRGLGTVGVSQIEEARENKAFTDLTDFCKRVSLPRKLIENLILIGAFDRWGIPRRQLLWELGNALRDDNALGLQFTPIEVDLPSFSHTEALYSEYRLLGLSPHEHIVALYRPLLTDRGILGSLGLLQQPDSTVVLVAGQVVMHQAPPTAKGHHFLTLEDEDGMMNVIVRPDIVTQTKTLPFWQGFGLNGWGLILVEGVVQHRGEVINVVAYRILPLIANAFTT